MLQEIAGIEHAQHLFVVRVKARDRVRAALRTRGVMADVHYPEALPLVPAYAGMGHKPADFPDAVRHAAECLSLPIFPGMREDEVRRVADALLASLAG
jgi:dTDP-4-amino-4,6-dideoxygalactose transaminase